MDKGTPGLLRRTILRKGRWIAVGSAVTVLVLVTGVLLATSRSTHASSSGGGGVCFSTSGPVCTFKNNDAFAGFGSVSSNSSSSSSSGGGGGGGGGCGIFTDANIQPFESLSRPGNTTSQSAMVFISKFDSCNGIQLEAASNFDPTTGAPDFTGTIQFGTGLSTATVNGTAPMFDYVTGTQFTTTINVSWQGFGPTTLRIDNSHFRVPNFIVNSHFDGTSRAAEASGILTDQTGTNLATLPSLYAELDNARGGTVQITGS